MSLQCKLSIEIDSYHSRDWKILSTQLFNRCDNINKKTRKKPLYMFIQMCVHSLRSPNLKFLQNLQKNKATAAQANLCTAKTMNFWHNELVNIK